METTGKNQALLLGRAGDLPRPSHVNHGIQYDTFPLEVERLSGTRDILNVVAARELLTACPICPGESYRLTGEIRSFNNRSGVGSRLVISFFARAVVPDGAEPENQLELEGALCKAPVLRRTPLGREICDLLLAVNRPYGRSDYLPCIAWGSLARSCGALSVGNRVHLLGRLQSRTYRKVVDGREEERTAYEVSVVSLEKVE